MSVPLLGSRRPALGLAATFALIVAAAVAPSAFGWNVRPTGTGGVAPLAAFFSPRVGPGTLPAVGLALLAARWGTSLATGLRWRPLLAVTVVVGFAWMTALATVDGLSGISAVVSRSGEYLPAARGVTDVGGAVRGFIDRIPLDSAHNWPTHVSGHPPGALLFFVGLVRLGLGGSLVSGWVIIAIAATTPLAVLVTLRRLGAEDAARAAAPFLVLAPAAIWSAVSADAVFAAVTAWGIAALAVAVTTSGVRRTIGALVAGLLIGYGVLLSYGLVLIAVIAIGVLVAGRDRGVPRTGIVVSAAVALLGALAVVLGFAAAGFAWWDALPVLRERYYDGLGGLRPASYWVWGDLAALAICAGPMAGAALAHTARRVTAATRPPAAVLAFSSAVALVLADLSFMSKAEVERIWLPFVPWLLAATALLPPAWRRVGLVVQLGTALLVQSLLHTRW